MNHKIYFLVLFVNKKKISNIPNNSSILYKQKFSFKKTNLKWIFFLESLDGKTNSKFGIYKK